MPPQPNHSAPVLDLLGQGGNQMSAGGQGQQQGQQSLKPITIGGQTLADRVRAFLNTQLPPGYTPGASMGPLVP